MIIYNTDYSRKDDTVVAWVKKISRKKKVTKIERVVNSSFVSTSYTGELFSVYLALVDALKCGYTTILIRNDNKAVIDLLNNKKKARKYEVKFLIYLLNYISGNIKNVKYEWVPRENNGEADRLSKEGHQ